MSNLSTYLLLIIGIVFILQLVTEGSTHDITNLFIFDPLKAFSEPWRFVTSMFLHAGLTHIFFNCYALFMFGSILEQKVSKKDYLIIFFIGGIIGGLSYFATFLLGIIPPIPALGASGAIYAVLGAVAMLLPDMRIFVLFFPMKMREAVLFWIFIEFLGTFDTGSGIASAAHLGGLMFGLLYGYYLKNRPREYYYPAGPFPQV